MTGGEGVKESKKTSLQEKKTTYIYTYHTSFTDSKGYYNIFYLTNAYVIDFASGREKEEEGEGG